MMRGISTHRETLAVIRTNPINTLIVYRKTRGARTEYSARDIGRETVRLSCENKCWISNLKLQKLLYFAWIEYYQETGTHLFEEPFQAWKYGPVVPSVYFDNWCNAAHTLVVPKRTSVEIDADTSDFLKRMLLRYRDVSVSQMVTLSHESQPWKGHYDPSKKVVIPFEDMEAEAFRSSI